MKCPSCSKNRPLNNKMAMRFGDKLCVVEIEKPVCSECLEDAFWMMHKTNVSKQN